VHPVQFLAKVHVVSEASIEGATTVSGFEPDMVDRASVRSDLTNEIINTVDRNMTNKTQDTDIQRKLKNNIKPPF
jgi:hypothetical protein